MSIDSTRWRDVEPETFAATITVAAEQLDVLPLAVEKDYWACQALRAITLSHPGEVIFKGGTSLEKLRVIRRFSEDLDLLIVGSYHSAKAAERALKEMIDSAATATGGATEKYRSGGKAGTFHRSAYLAPPLAHAAGPSAIADASAILVELGQSGGPMPSRAYSVSSLLGRQLADNGFDITEWEDLSNFDVTILHPGRTLIEKLLRVNNFTAQPEVTDTVHGWSRIGRQFYDIWALLGTGEVIELLENQELASDILASCFEISQQFTPDSPIPTGGFAHCAAFDPDNPLTERLRTEHQLALRDLYYGTEDPPDFDAVITRVREHAEHLDIL